MRMLAATLVVVLIALALVGCGGGEEPAAPSPAATAIWTGPLLVYTKEVRSTQTSGRLWPTIAVVTYDVGAKRELASFEIGQVGEYPAQVATGGDKIVANLEQRVVLYDIDGSNPSVLREAPEGGYIVWVAASPDSTMLASSEATSVSLTKASYAVAFLDIAAGDEILTVPQTDEGFAGFRGHVGPLTWRDDGRGVVVQGWTHSEMPGGTATVMLDGSVRTHDLRDFVLVALNGRYASHGSRASICEMFIGKSEIVLRDLDSETDLASVRGNGFILAPIEWSPDSKEFLYAAYTAREVQPRESCHLQRDPASERLYLLRVDGSPPEPVVDIEAVHERWYGDRHVELRCGDSPARHPLVCTDAQGNYQPVDIYVGDTRVGSGLDLHIIGFIEE